jgi:hypothetical protein
VEIFYFSHFFQWGVLATQRFLFRRFSKKRIGDERTGTTGWAGKGR